MSPEPEQTQTFACEAKRSTALSRFNGPLAFFDASIIKRQALAAIDAAGHDLCWFTLDLIRLTQVDVAGSHTLHAVADESE